MNEAQLLESKSTPSGKMSVGSKVIYNWPDMEVWVVSGKVTKVESRVPKTASEITEERKANKQAQLERQKQAEAQAAQLRETQMTQAQNTDQTTADYVQPTDGGVYMDDADLYRKRAVRQALRRRSHSAHRAR